MSEQHLHLEPYEDDGEISRPYPAVPPAPPKAGPTPQQQAREDWLQLQHMAIGMRARSGVRWTVYEHQLDGVLRALCGARDIVQSLAAGGDVGRLAEEAGRLVGRVPE